MATTIDFIVKNGLLVQGVGSAVSTSTGTGALIVNGGAGFNGDIHAHNIFANNAEVLTTGTIGSYDKIVHSIIPGTDISVDTTTNVVTISATSTLQSVTDRGSSTTNLIEILNVTSATSTSTGALIVAGGVGIAGDTYIGGNLIVDGTINATITGIISTATNLSAGVATNIPFQIDVGQTGFSNNLTFNDASDQLSVGLVNIWGNTSLGYEISSSTGAVISADPGNSIQIASDNEVILNYNNTSTVRADSSGVELAAGNNTLDWDYTGILSINGSNETADFLGAGALKLAGGAYIGNNVYVTNGLSASALTGRNLTNGRVTYTVNNQLSDSPHLLYDGLKLTVPGLVTTGTVSVNNPTQSTNSLTGALIVDGGAGIGGNLNVGGGFQVWGPATFGDSVVFSGTTTFVLSTNTVYTDNILELHTTGTVSTPWTFDDGKDIGLRFHYYNRSLNTGTNAALVLANDTQWLEWYGSGAEGTSTFSGYSYGGFKTGEIWVVNTANATTSTESGAFAVAGGVSIVQDLWVGGDIYRGGNLVVTQDQLSTATVTAIQAGPGISVTSSSGVVTVSNTGTLQFVTDNGSVTTNAVQITNSSPSTSTESGALVVSGGVGIGGNLYVGGNIVAPWSFVETTTVAGVNNTANWWINVLSFELPNIGDSTTFKVRTNAKVLNDVSRSDNSDSDYLYITYVKNGANTVLGSVTLGNENSAASNSFSVANHVVTHNSSTGYFEYWRRSPIIGGRVYTRIEEVLPVGVQPTLITTSTWRNAAPLLGGSVTPVTVTPGTFSTLGASSITLTSGGVGLSVSTSANIGTNAGGGTVNILTGTGAMSSKVVNIATGGGANSFSTINIGSTVTGSTDLLVINTTVTQFNSTLSAISTMTGAIQVRGGAGIGGNLYADTVYSRDREVITSVDLTSGTGINISSVSTNSGAFIATVNNTGVLSLTAGTDTVITTSTGDIAIWNNSTLQSLTDRSNSTTNALIIANSTSATSTNTGALVVSGGLGVGGDLWIGGILYSGGQAVLTTSSFFSAISEGSDIRITEGSSSTVIISNTSTLQSVTDRGSTTTNAIRFASVAQSTNTLTGALTVAGGVGISGQLNVGGTTSTIAGSLSVGTTANISNWRFYVSGNAFVSSDFSAATSSGSVSLGHNQTTGNWIAGGDRQTGIITLGRSTLTQTVSIANGAVGGGSIKTVNIGTEGLSTSTTQINIGTVNAGSTSTINLNGNIVVASGSKNSAAWTTNGVAIVQNSGTWTDVTSSGTIPNVYMNYFAPQTMAASTSVNVTTLFGTYFKDPNRGTNVGGSIAYSIGADNLYVAGNMYSNGITCAGQLTLSGLATTTTAQFATGATTAGNTKTVNIGTGGLAGSTTNINLGTTASTSTITLNGNVVISKIIANPAATTVNTTPVVLDSFGITEYRSAKYFISISNTGTNQYQTTEIWLIQDGTTAHIEQTSVFSSGTNVVAFTTEVNAGTVSLIALGANSNNSIKVQSTYITV